MERTVDATGRPVTDVAKLTDGQMLDLLCRTVGFGRWDEGLGETYYGWRGTQVAIMKGVKNKRKITNEELYACALYCQAHREPAMNFNNLCRWVYEAKKWLREGTGVPTTLDKDVQLALVYEDHQSDDQSDYWQGRLVRAMGPLRAEVLKEWKQARQL